VFVTRIQIADNIFLLRMFNFDFLFEKQLFLIIILHQTTTVNKSPIPQGQLFLIIILHQTTTGAIKALDMNLLFLIIILHQTTTRLMMVNAV
jgi:hypothetical protein